MNLWQKICVTATLVASLSGTEAAAQSLEAFAGRWNGTVSVKSGPEQKRLRCAATNRLGGGGIRLSIRCGDAMRVSATVRETNGRLSGEWSSPFVSGTLAGTRHLNSIRLRIESAAYSTTVTITRAGDVLHVSVEPTSLTEGLSVAMIR